MSDVEPDGQGGALPDHVEATIGAIADLHARHQRKATPSQRSFALLANVLSRPRSLGAVTVALLVWVVGNLAVSALGWRAWDPAPFYWMQAAVGVAALYTTVTILIAQRHEDELARLREQLTLELAMLSEQKSAKTIQLLESLRRDLPSVPNIDDPEAQTMSQPADAMAVADALIERHETEVLQTLHNPGDD